MASGDVALASKPTTCLGSIVRRLCGQEASGSVNDAMDRQLSNRASILGIANEKPDSDEKGICSRRGGVQSDTSAVLQGLKDKFDQMESLEDDNDQKRAEMIGTQDIDFIRMLQPSQFKMFLKVHEIDPDAFRKGNAKSVKDLWTEVVFRECELQQVKTANGSLGLQRFVRVIMVELEAECADGEVKHLMLKDETQAKKGRSRKNLFTRMSKKMFDDETVKTAMWRCILQNMTLEEHLCKMHFQVLSTTNASEYKMSSGFPGLPTSYDLHVVRMRVNIPEHEGLKRLGLPNGTDFKTQNSSKQGPPSTRLWAWCSKQDFDAAKEATAGSTDNPEYDFRSDQPA